MIVVYAFIIWCFLTFAECFLLMQWFLNNGASHSDLLRYIDAHVDTIALLQLALMISSYIIAGIIA